MDDVGAGARLSMKGATVTRADLCEAVHEQVGLTRQDCSELVERVLAAGCEAVCVTVDVPVNGPRDREYRAGFALPPGVERANLASRGAAFSAAAQIENAKVKSAAKHAT